MGLFDSVGAVFNPTKWGSDEDPLFGGPLGDLIPGIGDARAQQNANNLNIAEAQKNRDFQKDMSSTAYQRAMTDMKAAGLNPILAYSQGGASTPSGSTATVQAAPKTGLTSAALSAYTGINTAKNQNTSVQQAQDMTESSIKLNQANEVKTAAETQRILENTKLDKGGTAAKVLGTDVSTWLKNRFKAIKNSSAIQQKKNKEPPLIKVLKDQKQKPGEPSLSNFFFGKKKG